jgi:hypothetical protein
LYFPWLGTTASKRIQIRKIRRAVFEKFPEHEGSSRFIAD